MTNEGIVKELRCISTDGNVAPDCKGCPFYAKEHLDPEWAAKVGTDELDSCDCNAVGFAAADLIESQQRHIEALMQANDALRDTVLRQDAQIEKLAADRKALINELCQYCGKYKCAHKGACDGCRWKQ